MRVHVTLRGAIAGDGQPQHRMSVQLPWGSTVEYLIGHLSIASAEVQMALVNGSPVVRSAVLNNGDRVILAAAS
ncbi:MAG: ubiquitin family protein [Chloroflexota bacterium]